MSELRKKLIQKINRLPEKDLHLLNLLIDRFNIQAKPVVETQYIPITNENTAAKRENLQETTQYEKIGQKIKEAYTGIFQHTPTHTTGQTEKEENNDELLHKLTSFYHPQKKR